MNVFDKFELKREIKEEILDEISTDGTQLNRAVKDIIKIQELNNKNN